MRKIWLVICLFVVLSFNSWGQSFNLPTMTNTTESIQSALRELLENTKNIGSPDYKGDWNYSQELFLKDMTAYLNSVLDNLNYSSLRNYTRLTRNNINNINIQTISRNQMTNFDIFLHKIFPDRDREIHTMQNEYKTKPFPLMIKHDEKVISETTRQIQIYQQELNDYQNQLDKLPTIAQLNNRLQEIRRELLQPNVVRNTKLKKQLEDEEAAINKQKLEIDIEHKRLTKHISDTQTQIRRSNIENNINEMEAAERNKIITSVWTSFCDFYEWEKFFNDENTCLKDFFILKNTRQKLYNMLDHIPQGQVQGFRTRLDVFCAEWGI